MSTDLEKVSHPRTHELPLLCRYLSELSPQPMVALEGTTHLVDYINPAFSLLVKKEKKNLVGRPFAEAVPEGNENGCLALLDRVFRTGKPENLAEQEHHHTEPGPVYWSYAVWAILGPDELPVGVMIQVTDATETALFRRQVTAMNEALLLSATRQHRLAAEGESLNARLQTSVQSRDHFLAALSHELRNPLAAMSNGLQLLQQQTGNDPASVDRLRAMIERQLNLLVRLVDDLLDISRITTGKLELRRERIDLKAIIRDAVESSRPLIDRQGQELTVTLPPDPVLMVADPTRLAQVVLNLLNNAAKYSEMGGQIKLSIERRDDDVFVSVRDTGIGIPAEHLPHVFDIFVQVDSAWQRSQGGLGIGLSLVKEFVELHGGRVEARSDGLEKGSEFIVRLPMVAVEPPALMAPTEISNGRRSRILVVDDNRDAADSLAEMLAMLGYEVRTSYDGEAGVIAVSEFRPELVLMDLGMPRLNGYDAARKIRAGPRGGEPFLVALTGWGADDDRRRTQDAGFDRHLTKPVPLDALVKLIAEVQHE